MVSRLRPDDAPRYVENENLRHVLAFDCTDNDCEIHNIDVAIEEEVVGPHELAFFLAGAQAALVLVPTIMLRYIFWAAIVEKFVPEEVRSGST